MAGAAPRDVVFDEPWQAQAFAITVALQGCGLFDWAEWTSRLAAVIHAPATAALPYYEQWMLALERLCAERGVALPSDLDALGEAWERAAEATPHGQPIRLENDPHGGAAFIPPAGAAAS